MSIVSFLNELTHQVVPSVTICRGPKASLLPAKVDVRKSAGAFASKAVVADRTVRDEVD